MKNDWKSIEDSLNEKFVNLFRLPNISLSETIKIFLEVVKKGKIVSLTEGLEIRYGANPEFNKFELARKNISTSIESFYKTLYGFIDRSEFNGTMVNCLNRFFNQVDVNFWTSEKNNFLTSKQDPNPKKLS